LMLLCNSSMGNSGSPRSRRVMLSYIWTNHRTCFTKIIQKH
jgi:hypothetical protein